MGKCVSKDHQLHIKAIGETSYIAISDEFEYYHNNEGQSESKKSAKKGSGPQTKGTAMSFGFKKKIQGTSSKKQNNNVNNSFEKEKEMGMYDQQTATIITNHNVIKDEQYNNLITASDDDNGNTGLDKEATGRSTPRLQPPKRDQLVGGVINGRSNRFGFRQNTVRPASVGLTPKINDFDENVLNNNDASVTDKRRSKSATARSNNSTTIQQQQHFRYNPKIVNTTYEEQQQQQKQQHNNTNNNYSDARHISHHNNSYAVIKTDMHTNPIIRPTPQSASASKYTLHSASLPKPQYAVSVSLSSASSTTSSYANSTSNACVTNKSFNNNHYKGNQTINNNNNVHDTKTAKHAENLNRKGGLSGRDESYDSGIASHDSCTEQHQHYMDAMISRRPRQRSRHFEMVMSGRHKFEIRDLNNLMDNDKIVPLSLPKLPSAFNNEEKEIIVGGLVRSTNNCGYNTDNESNMSISCDSNMSTVNNYQSRPTSLISTSEAESCEEEKLNIDNNSSEKTMKDPVIELIPHNSKLSSPGSSRSSYYNAGECMALKDCSSISLSSSDEERRNVLNASNKKSMECDEDDISTVTLTNDHTSYLNSMQSKTPSLHTENDAFMRQPTTPASKSRKEMFMQMEELKFAEMAAAVKDSALLDDETSPTDSLVSSTDSDDILMKKKHKEYPKKEAIEEEIEEDLDDITPEFVDLVSPVTPGSPTHASNSLSFSDGGRDFLIDDEIADQPALMFNDKRQKSNTSQSEYIISSVLNLNSDTTTTPTLKDISVDSRGSLKSVNMLQRLNKQSTYSLSASKQKPMKKSLSRAESLDTLSPCDSITSDDLMADFELNSSLDSIDRPALSFDNLNTSNSIIQSNDDMQLFTNMEYKGTDLMRDWSTLLKNQQPKRSNSSRESVTSQLPARATRLLNRRLQNTSNSPLSQSDSPRSLDSINSRNTCKSSLKEHLKQKQQQNLQSQLINSSSEDLLLDKSLRNSMLQDVVTFKKQLVHLRRILQETDTLNPFESYNGQLFNNNYMNDSTSDAKTTTVSDKDKKDDENNVTLTTEQLLMLEDQRRELADLRRQVVFLQGQMDDKDRTIKIQQVMLDTSEKEKTKLMHQSERTTQLECDNTLIETTNSATQTERLRPVSMGQDTITSFSQNEPTIATKTPENSTNNSINNNNNNNNNNNKIPTMCVKPLLPKSKTQISSVYTKLSSIKPLSATNIISTTSNANKNSSIPNYTNCKSVKTTSIGNAAAAVAANAGTKMSTTLAPAKKISQLVKPQVIIGASKIAIKSLKSFAMKPTGNGTQNQTKPASSLSSSSSSSSLSSSTLAENIKTNGYNRSYKNGISNH
ncbi:unnamed protein product [Diamesa serratosioi]